MKIVFFGTPEFAIPSLNLIIKSDCLNNLYEYIQNRDYARTNMVYSFNEVIKKYKSQNYYIFYADIIFDSKNIRF